jgi:methionyl-tRNA formyltransferase
VTTFFLDHDIDTGRIIMKKTFDIPDDADVEYVYDGLMHLGAEICLETLQAIIDADGYPVTIAQDDANSQQPIANSPLKSAPKIFKETCEIDWTKTAKQVYDFVRGLSPYPGAWTTLVTPDDKETVLKIIKTRKTGLECQAETGSLRIEGKQLQVAAADQWLQLEELQLAGKKRMAVRDFLNGMKDIDQCRIK